MHNRATEPSADRIARRDVLKALGISTAAAMGVSTVPSVGARSYNTPADTAEIEEGEFAYQYFHEEWTEIEADVERLAELGVDKLWVMQPAAGKLAWEDLSYEGETGFYDETSPYGFRDPHPPLGYQPVDYRNLDSELGTEAELESMIDTCHEHDIEVVVDVVLNHMAAPDGPDGFVDLPQFDRDEDFHDFGTIGEDCELDGERARYECDLLALPSFDVERENVQNAQREYIERIAELGADGLRYDAALHVWPWYWAEEINPLADEEGLWRVGEIWDEGDVGLQLEFADTGMTVFDFPLYRAIKDGFEFENLRLLQQSEGRGVVHERPEVAVTFAQNHDTVGPGVEEGDAEGRLVKLAELFLLAYPGMPMLYRSNPEDRPLLDDDELATAAEVCSDLATGDLIDRHADDTTYVFEREGNLLAGVNIGDSSRTITVDTNWSDETIVDQLGGGNDVAVADDGTATITLPGESVVLYAPGDGDPPEPPEEPELIAEWDDESGDDHGPGSYEYPTADEFVDGAFDLTGFEVYEGEDVHRFVLELSELTNPWGLDGGYSLQYPQIYVHDPAASDDDAAELAAAGVNVQLGEPCHRRIRANGGDGAVVETGTGDELATGSTVGDLDENTIEIEIPADTIEGPLEDVELVPLLLGYDGFEEDDVRPVEATVGEYVFGGGEDSTINPNVIDVVTPEGLDNSDALSYDPDADEGAIVPLLSIDADDDGESAFEVHDLTAPETARQGDAIDVSATVENVGSAAGNPTAAFEVAGDTVATETVALDAGESTALSFDSIDTTPLDPGSYTHGITAGDAEATATIEITPGVATYENEDGEIDRDGLTQALDDWQAGAIETDVLIDVINAWAT